MSHAKHCLKVVSETPPIFLVILDVCYALLYMSQPFIFNKLKHTFETEKRFCLCRGVIAYMLHANSYMYVT